MYVCTYLRTNMHTHSIMYCVYAHTSPLTYRAAWKQECGLQALTSGIGPGTQAQESLVRTVVCGGKCGAVGEAEDGHVGQQQTVEPSEHEDSVTGGRDGRVGVSVSAGGGQSLDGHAQLSGIIPSSTG